MVLLVCDSMIYASPGHPEIQVVPALCYNLFLDPQLIENDSEQFFHMHINSYVYSDLKASISKAHGSEKVCSSHLDL